MYPIAAIGLLTIGLSVYMIVTPEGWSNGILAFSEKPYFHVFEIVSRFLLGVVLIFFAGETLHTGFFTYFGYLLFGVSIFLLIMGQKRHRAFALRSAGFGKWFRPAGFFSLAFGVFVIYSAIGRSMGWE